MYLTLQQSAGGESPYNRRFRRSILRIEQWESFRDIALTVRSKHRPHVVQPVSVNCSAGLGIRGDPLP